MAFNKFTWTDRTVEYPDRKKLVDAATQSETIVNMYRHEGTVQTEGSAFNAENMNNLEDRIDEMFPVSINNIKKSDLLDYIYPVGSIYMSVSGTNPSILFGGTWEQIQDTFLLAAGSTYIAGTTGGSEAHTHTTENHTLTINEIPSHSHNFNSADDGSSMSMWAYTNTLRKSSKNSTDATGGGGPHNHGNTLESSNLPPYLTVYVFKRTA